MVNVSVLNSLCTATNRCRHNDMWLWPNQSDIMRPFHFRRRINNKNFRKSIKSSLLICVDIKKPEIERHRDRDPGCHDLRIKTAKTCSRHLLSEKTLLIKWSNSTQSWKAILDSLHYDIRANRRKKQALIEICGCLTETWCNTVSPEVKCTLNSWRAAEHCRSVNY